MFLITGCEAFSAYTYTHAAGGSGKKKKHLVSRSPSGPMDAKRRDAFDKEVASSLVRPPVALRPIAAAAAGSAALLDMYAMALQPYMPVDVPLGRHLRVYRPSAKARRCDDAHRIARLCARVHIRR